MDAKTENAAAPVPCDAPAAPGVAAAVGDAAAPAGGVVGAAAAHRNPRGIAWMIAGVATLALMDAGLKRLAEHYPAMQVAALRGIASVPLVIAWTLYRGKLGSLVRVRWGLQITRGLLAIVMLATFAYGLKNLPLSETYSLFFAAPLIIIVQSVLFLGERIDAKRWIAIAVGLVGMLIVLRPTGAGLFTLGGVAIIASAACYATAAVIVRVASRTDTTESLMFWMTATLSVGAGLLAWPEWVALHASDAWVIAGVAVTGAVGTYAITEAFRWGQASVVAPFEYTALAWGIVLDLALWGTLPDGYVYLGAAVIVASGIYLARREAADARH